MSTEICNKGDVTLVYNDEVGHPVWLTKDQHKMLQIFVASLGAIGVNKKEKVIYKPMDWVEENGGP